MRRLALALVAAAGLSGCRTEYLAQLAYEEARYLARARPVQEWIAETDDPERRHTLELVLEARQFAADHGLDPGQSYLKVTDTSAAAPFQVVTASRFDRLEPYTWWYPVLGQFPYRGYFDPEQARAYASTLQKQEELDTYIVEASAYSTLGWFADPLPSKVLDGGPIATAITIFHELVHQNFFVSGQVAFNETLASGVSYRLAADFFDERGDAAAADRVRRARLDWLARSRLLDRGAVELRALFATARQEKWSRDRILAERKNVYRSIQQEAAAESAAIAASLRNIGWNNAAFLASHRYAERAALIDDFLAGHGDLSAALERLRSLTRGGKDAYEALVRASVAMNLGH